MTINKSIELKLRQGTKYVNINQQLTFTCNCDKNVCHKRV